MTKPASFINNESPFKKSYQDFYKKVMLNLITEFYPPDYAATGQLIEELVIQLKEQGIQIHILTSQPRYANNKSKVIPVELTDYLWIKRFKFSQIWPQRIRGKVINGLLFCLRSALHLLNPCCRGDILLLTTAPPFLGIVGYLAKKCLGMPYICLVYDLYPNVAVNLNIIPDHHWLVRLWHRINGLVWQEAETIVAISPTMKDRIITHHPQLNKKIIVIHNWANPQVIQPICKYKNWFAQKYGLIDKFVVLYSGNLGRCHDLDTIIAAAQLLKEEPIQFLFIGAGAKLQQSRDMVNEAKLSNCLFLPYQDKEVLPYSLTSCDLGLVSIAPGLEGIVAPSKLYGLLAAGRPVAAICEPHSYLRQLLSNANCGQAFQNGDGKSLGKFIRSLYLNPQKGAKMGKDGRNYLESHFTPEIIALEYSQVLHCCISMVNLK